MRPMREEILENVQNRVDGLVRHYSARGSNVLLAGPWGSGKTTLLRKLKKNYDEHYLVQTKDGWTAPYVMAFSPWETMATSDPIAGFLKFISNELTRAEALSTDKVVQERLKKIITALGGAILAIVGKTLDFGVAEAAKSMGMPSDVVKSIAPTKLVEELWKILETDSTEPLPISDVDRARLAIKKVLKEIAEAHKKDRLLLLIDDLDRCRPDHALTLLDNLYHIFLPREQTLSVDETDWPLTCIWALDTAVLREFVHSQYRDLPSFRAEAYLEKLFHHRVDLPPLVHTDEAKELWKSVLTADENNKNFQEVIEAIIRHVDYSIMGNLRLHRNIAEAFKSYVDHCGRNQREISNEDWPRIVQLLILSRAFPGFRETIGMYNGNWPAFVEKLNRARAGSERHRWEPYGHFAHDPCLATLLLELKAIKVKPEGNGMWRWESDKSGQERLIRDLVELVRSGF